MLVDFDAGRYPVAGFLGFAFFLGVPSADPSKDFLDFLGLPENIPFFFSVFVNPAAVDANILSPLTFVGPVRSRHLTLGDVLSVTSFEGFTTSLLLGCLGIGTCTTHALLTIAYCLHIIAFLGDHNMRFGGVLGGSLRLVVARDSDSG